MRVTRGAAGALLSLIALGGALVFLAVIQYRSIDQLAENERQRMKSSIDFAARHFGDELDHELTRLFIGFQMPRPDASPEVMLRRYEEWAMTARDPRLVKMMWFVSPGDLQTLVRIDPHAQKIENVSWPQSLDGAREMIARDFEQHEHAPPLMQKEGLMLVPCGGRRLGGPPMHGGHPPEAGPPDGPPQGPPEDGPPMPGMPRPDHERPMPPVFTIVELDRNVLTSTLLPELTRRYFENGFDVQLANHQSGEVLYRSDNAKTPFVAEASVPTLRVLHFANGEPTPPSREEWMLDVAHRGGSLEQMVATTRRRNLMIGSGVLLVLAASAIALMLMLRRAEMLRVQQLEFVAGVTHELNTPLAALHSAGQNLADGVTHEPAQVARYGSMIMKESRRLGDMVAQVLEYAGIESGRPRRQQTFVDVSAVIDDAVSHTRWMCDEEKVAVDVQVESDLPPVDGDAQSLSRALQNLIGNAVKYGCAGKWIGVRARRNGAGVMIEVEDAGAGIASEDARHLFEPFYRGRGSDRARGSGLGLTIVKKIVDEHRGTVQVGRSSRGGASFAIHLPEARRV